MSVHTEQLTPIGSATPGKSTNKGLQIRLDDVALAYGSSLVLNKLSLTIEAGEFFTLLGPSGCGKTTTLRLVAGLLSPTAGTIRFGARDVTEVPVHKRDVAMVFQNYGLMPHYSVIDNVAYGLKMRRVPRARRRAKALEALDLVGLSGLADRSPADLSGGQQQRVGLARAVAVETGIMLLDEPLSNLDTTLRQQMSGELRALQRKLGVTVLYVTHDRGEALAMSDRIGVMQSGSILDIGSPDQLYAKPRFLTSARLLGDINEFTLTAVGDGFAGASGQIVAIPHRPAAGSASVLIGVRPEDLRMHGPSFSSSEVVGNRLTAQVVSVEYSGATSVVCARVLGADNLVTARIARDLLASDVLAPGMTVTVAWDERNTHLFEDAA